MDNATNLNDISANDKQKSDIFASMYSQLLFLSIIISIAAGGLIDVPVACLRDEPRHAAQLVSQAVMGTPVEVSDTTGEWLRVTTPDGYSGYMTSASVTLRDLDEWRNASRAVVTDPAGCVLTDNNGAVVVRLPLNSIVETTDDGSYALPDGRSGTSSVKLASIEEWASQPFDGDKITDTAYALLGAPYLWGGMSGAAMDCSGLVGICYMANGRILRRDAWMQAADCDRIDAPSRRGDLIFFDRSGRDRIDHVAIYDRDSLYIHCSGMVKVNALTPEHGDTISGSIAGFGRPSDGHASTPVILHPLYF